MKNKQQAIELQIMRIFKDNSCEIGDIIFSLLKMAASLSVLFRTEKGSICESLSQLFDEYEEIGNKIPEISEFWSSLQKQPSKSRNQ